MFRGLDETDSDVSTESSSSSEKDSVSFKRKQLAKKVVRLRKELEEKECNREVAHEDKLPKEVKKPEEIEAETSETFESVPLSVEDLKLANQRLLDEQNLLKRNLNQSIKKGDFKEAEKLSDLISKHESEFKVNQTAIAKDFLKRKREKEEQKARKRRKKLAWVFETKKKWETKSNM